MKYLSVCSGIEAASVAWEPLGWEPVGFSEIEKFPSAVLAHHYPSTPNLGDMTKFKDWPDANVNVLVGGTPCQSFSVAGLRKGMDDPRGNLALTFLAIADQYRPQWVLWENVPGVLSSAGGRDFGSIIGGLVECGYGVCYRVLDAQFVRVDGFGRAVPQRRRRVFVVGNLGGWRRSAAVLFERESLSGHSPPRRKTGERVADSLTVGAIQYSGFCGEPVSMSLNVHGVRMDAESETLIAFEANMSQQKPDATGVHPTLTRQTYASVYFAQNSRDEVREMDVVGVLAARTGMKQQSYIRGGFVVRRLTPTECERLQGFPDGYTHVPYRGKEASDGPRYKALGNSMAVNVMRWIGTRIDLVSKLETV